MADMMQQMHERMGGGMGRMGQPAKPAQAAEPTLEEMLNKALKDNPDIRVAEAKVREADAELNRTRLQVTQKVLAFHHARESQKAIIKVAEEDLQRIQKLEANKAVSQEEVKQAQQRLSASKAKLAEIEAEMPYLLGQQQRLAVGSATISPEGKWLISNTDGTVKLWESTIINPTKPSDIKWQTPILENSNSNFIDSGIFQFIGQVNQATKETGTIADKVRKALETQVTVDYKQRTVHDILEDLKKKVPGLSIHDLSGVSQIVINLHIDGQVPLRTALEMLEDTGSVLHQSESSGRLSFVLRDYGLLFAPNGNLPSDAVHISNLGRGLKLTKPENDKAPAKDEKKPSGEERKH
ncbi:MAG TPA: hypothetical protein VGX70_12290 [Gemmataceae bacterium]|jgi:hypothetical protein|nr:hypothetical protein [Gemmataceae bacterium]